MFKSVILVAGLGVVSATGAGAATIIADTLIDSFASGNGTLTEPYGGTNPGTFPVALSDYSNALDGDLATFVSLPEDSYITVGFSSGFVFDGAGNDLFIAENGTSSELADIFISSDFGATFTYLGQADGGTVTEFDLGAISYTDNVNAVKIVGLDNLGGSPGFDVAYVEGLEGSVSVVPVAPALPLMASALGLMAIVRRARKG